VKKNSKEMMMMVVCTLTKGLGHPVQSPKRESMMMRRILSTFREGRVGTVEPIMLVIVAKRTIA
jgi:hypothetical protein